MLLSWTLVIAILKILIVGVHGQRHLIFFKFLKPQDSLIIIVFNIEIYLKYLLFDKLQGLMDLNIFVILS